MHSDVERSFNLLHITIALTARARTVGLDKLAVEKVL